LKSAGLLPYRRTNDLHVLIAHPGGPFWAKKDEGAWSVIKGLIEEAEDEQLAAAREFTEETGWPAPEAPWIDLGEIRLRSGKLVQVWAAEADYDPVTLQPGMFTTTLRGKPVSFPEVDRVAWFDLGTARRKLNPAYEETLNRLERQATRSG
jgi:predicted NUDIX family NTP pyrophosphohydrolase